MTFRTACKPGLPAGGDAWLKLGTGEIGSQPLAGIERIFRKERLACPILEPAEQRQGRRGKIAPDRLPMTGNLDRFRHFDPMLSGEDIVRHHGAAQKPAVSSVAEKVFCSWRIRPRLTARRTRSAG
jgi:hypothetical protein